MGRSRPHLCLHEEERSGGRRFDRCWTKHIGSGLPTFLQALFSFTSRIFSRTFSTTGTPVNHLSMRATECAAGLGTGLL
jgi:hypothetical protein